MKVTLTQKLDLEAIKLPFEMSFYWTKKRGVSDNVEHWFTPSGKCKVYIGGLNNVYLGNINSSVWHELHKMLLKAKNDILTDGSNYYTIGDKNIIEIKNMDIILHQANKEWEKRKYMGRKKIYRTLGIG